MNTTTGSDIITQIVLGSSVNGYINGASVIANPSGVGNATLQNVDVLIGAMRFSTNNTGFYLPLNGDISEIIIYSTAINSYERTLIENYLSAKYGLTPTQNDKYDGDEAGNGDFDLDVAGIGRESDGTYTAAQSVGMMVQNGTFLQDDGDWLMFGHKDASNAMVTTDLPSNWNASSSERWSRHWYIEVTDNGTNGGTVNMTFDFSEAGVGGTPTGTASDYRLLKRTGATGDFSDITVSSGATVSISDDQVIFTGVNVNELGSNFTLGNTDTPLLAELASLAAVAAGHDVNITWDTTTELDNLGFNIYRSTNVEEVGEQLNSELIPSQAPGSGTGAHYSWTDQDVGSAQTFYYRITDVNTSGVESFHGPVSVDMPAVTTAVSVSQLGTIERPSPVLWLLGITMMGIVLGLVIRRRRA